MNFYNRSGKLYLKLNDVRLSTNLEYNQKNINYISSLPSNHKFFNKWNVKKSYTNVLDLCKIVLDKKESYLKQTTLKIYYSVFQTHIKPNFDIDVEKVTPKMIHDFYNNFSNGSLIITCEAILKEAFQIALINGDIYQSPFVVKKPKFKSDYKINPFTLDEIKIILDSCEFLWFKNLLGVAFFTGARIGELLALTWKDIDFDNYTINIDKTYTNGILQTPKTRSSIRIIDMIEQSEVFLLSQKKITGLSNYVFLSNNHKICSSSYLFPFWKDTINKTDLEYRNIYQTRHTFASNMLSNGESLQWVSDMLGHKSTTPTQNYYYKYIPKKRAKRKSTFLDDTQILAQLS